MLNSFKTFAADRLQLDDLVVLSAFGRQIRAEYEALQLDEPEYVDVQLKSLRREIHARVADKLEARRKEITSRLDSLKTPQQRKAELQKELRTLDEQLANV